MQQMAAIDELYNEILQDARWEGCYILLFLSKSSLISLLMFQQFAHKC